MEIFLLLVHTFFALGCQHYYTDLGKVEEHGTEYTFAPTSKPAPIDAAAATTAASLAAGVATTAAGFLQAESHHRADVVAQSNESSALCSQS